MLGDFNDRCIALSFLSDNTINTLPEAERGALSSWRSALLQGKKKYANNR